jgi:predicted PurR-regulated permease PerM
VIAPLTTRYTVAAWILTAIALVGVIHLRLLPALLAGLLVYELVHVIAARLRYMSGTRGRIAGVTLISIVIVALLVGLMFGLIAFIRSDSGSLPGLLRRLAEMVEGARGKLPDWLVENLPANADRLRDAAIAWLHENSKELRIVGGEVGHTIVHILIGMVIGAMVSLREAMPASERGPFALELLERATRMGDAFRNVVFAQVRISALNTVFTAIYLLAVLPMFDVQLPFAKTLVAITFLTGLLPVVGNLISNTVIVIVSLNVSIDAALASLGFLVVIHKLEYFLNARIVGSHIHAKAWELLLAMLVMESAFGLAGLVAAPIYYAYLKDELNYRALL